VYLKKRNLVETIWHIVSFIVYTKLLSMSSSCTLPCFDTRLKEVSSMDNGYLRGEFSEGQCSPCTWSNLSIEVIVRRGAGGEGRVGGYTQHSHSSAVNLSLVCDQYLTLYDNHSSQY